MDLRLQDLKILVDLKPPPPPSLKYIFVFVPPACQRGGLVSVWPLPGGWLRGGGAGVVGREEQAVCGQVPFESRCRCWPSCGQRSKVTVPACVCCRQKHEKGFTVCGLAWHPSGGQIAYTDTEGRLGLLDGVGAAGTDTSKVLETHLKLQPPPHHHHCGDQRLNPRFSSPPLKSPPRTTMACLTRTMTRTESWTKD